MSDFGVVCVFVIFIVMRMYMSNVNVDIFVIFIVVEMVMVFVGMVY